VRGEYSETTCHTSPMIGSANDSSNLC